MVIVVSDSIIVLVWEKEDHPVGYGAKVLVEVYGPFGGWDESVAFVAGLRVSAHQEVEQRVLRNPALSAVRGAVWRVGDGAAEVIG